MQENNISKIILIIVVIFIIVSGSFYGYLRYSKKNNPYLTLSPTSYPAGTKVNLYTNVPPDFPSSLILENKALKYSGTIVTPDNKKQITLAYISDIKILKLSDMYSNFLTSTGWRVESNNIGQNVATIKATLNSQNVLITIAPIKATSTMVTFQYEH